MARRCCRRWSGWESSRPHRAAIERDLVREAHEARLRAELERRFEVGGLEEAALRALIYIRLPEGSIDERGFAVLKLIRASRPAAKRMSLARFKEMLREQYLLVRLDEERAISALPKLLGPMMPRRARRRSMSCIGSSPHVASLSDEGTRRLARVEALFDAQPGKTVKAEAAHA